MLSLSQSLSKWVIRSLLCLLLLCSSAHSSEVIQLQKQTFRSATDIASRLEGELQQQPKGRRILDYSNHRILFERGRRTIEINDIPVYLGFPTLEHDRDIYLPDLDWQFTLKPILQPATAGVLPIRRIVLDPGHGGKDPGAINPEAELEEKTLTLEVCKALRKKLKKSGFTVYLTRKKDHYLPLPERSSFANKQQADLFLSIHFNAFHLPSAVGIETFVYPLMGHPSSSRQHPDASDQIFQFANRHDRQNILIGYHLQRSLSNRINEPNRGLKRARFEVLRSLNCPGALVELGFISHSETSRQIRTGNRMDQLVDALYEGILNYSKLQPSR